MLSLLLLVLLGIWTRKLMLLISLDHGVHPKDCSAVREKKLKFRVAMKLPYLPWATYLWSFLGKGGQRNFYQI